MPQGYFNQPNQGIVIGSAFMNSIMQSYNRAQFMQADITRFKAQERRFTEDREFRLEDREIRNFALLNKAQQDLAVSKQNDITFGRDTSSITRMREKNVSDLTELLGTSISQIGAGGTGDIDQAGDADLGDTGTAEPSALTQIGTSARSDVATAPKTIGQIGGPQAKFGPEGKRYLEVPGQPPNILGYEIKVDETGLAVPDFNKPVTGRSTTLAGERLRRYHEAIAQGDEKAAELALYGKPLVQLSLGKPASAAERTKIAETRASVDALDNLKMLFDSEKTVTGPVVGKIEPIKGLFGWTTMPQEDFMAATSAFKNKIIKEITGAQMSEVEAKRIMKQVPDITDPPIRWEAKWRQSKKNLEFLQNRRLEILRQSGIRVPEDQQQPQQDEIPTPKTQADFDAIPAGTEFIDTDGKRKVKQ